MAKIADRIKSERAHRFVGRNPEREIFRQALAGESPYCVLLVSGPGGIGKTSLLHEFERISEQAVRRFFTIDGRNLQATPASFLTALNLAAGSESQERLANTVLLIDTYEAIQELDPWLRETFIPELPESAIVVIFGRRRPGPGWLQDAWIPICRSIPLRNLSASDAKVMLEHRSVPPEDQQKIIGLTHGHPLALALAAENYVQGIGSGPDDVATQNVVRLLLDRFLEGVDDPRKRDALELCALARTTTEGLISHVLDSESAPELFDWLKSLSFVETSEQGVAPHDLARDVLLAELRWRNPDRYSHLHHRARDFYADHLERSSGKAQQTVLFEYIYLHRENPVVGPSFRWHEKPAAFPDVARSSDAGQIVEMVRRHEGGASALSAERLFGAAPEMFQAFRAEGGRIDGFVAMLELNRLEPEIVGRDEPLLRADAYLQKNAPQRTNERAIYVRFWMSREEYQAVSPIQSAIFVSIVQTYLTAPNLATTFLACADPENWEPMFDYAMTHRLPELDYATGDRNYGVFFFDWRVTPPRRWLQLLAERETPLQDRAKPGPSRPDVLVLSQEGFSQCVSDALKSLHNPTRLARNPLLRSRLVLDRTPEDADTPARIETLRKLIGESIMALKTGQRDTKLYRALDATYIRPKRSQEAAAETVDVSIATFRRHLKSGTDIVVDTLWQLELDPRNRPSGSSA